MVMGSCINIDRTDGEWVYVYVCVCGSSKYVDTKDEGGHTRTFVPQPSQGQCPPQREIHDIRAEKDAIVQSVGVQLLFAVRTEAEYGPCR